MPWNITAMFAQSFFTALLITRFGAPRIVTIRLLHTACAAVAGLLGIDVAHLWVALVLLGPG